MTHICNWLVKPAGPQQWRSLILILLMLTLVLTAFSPAVLAAEDDIDVLVNGRSIAFDVPPLLDSGRVLVPFRLIAQSMGIQVHWNQVTRTVEAFHGDTTVRIPVGSLEATVSGRTVSLDVPARITEGRTLVPLRFFSEAFGANVHWDGPSRTVTIGFEPPEWPPTKEGMIEIEGMPEPVTLNLLVTDRFITYVPTNMTASSSADDVWIHAAFGGVHNEDAYLRMSFFPGLQDPPSPATVGNLLDLNGFTLQTTDPGEHRHSWSISEFTAVNHADFSLSGSVGIQNGEPFVVLVHIPWEYGDGFGPRAELILNHLFWTDSNSYLVP